MVLITVGMNDKAAYALLYKLLSMHCSLISQSDLFTGHDEQIWLRNLSPIVCMWFKKATLVPLITVLGREQTKGLFLKILDCCYVLSFVHPGINCHPVQYAPNLSNYPASLHWIRGWMDGYIGFFFWELVVRVVVAVPFYLWLPVGSLDV